MARLPSIGSDTNNWGTVLNEYLSVVHNSDGTVKTGILPITTVGNLQTTLDTKITSIGSPISTNNIWVGTQSMYDALTPNGNTIYFIL